MTTAPLPKYLAVSRAIEASIASGRAEGRKVPSARDVAEVHGVSVVTASRALQVLRDKGLIETVDRSGSFLLPEAGAGIVRVPGTGRAAERFGLLLRCTPGPWRLASMSVPLAGFVAACRERGVELEPDLFEGGDPASVARQAAGRGVSGLFFMPSRLSVESALEDEATLSACVEAGLAVVLVERNLRGPARPLAHDLVGTDDLEGGLVSTVHLIEQGRERVAFVTASPISTHEARVAGYLAALHRASAGRRKAMTPLVLEQRSDLPTRAAYEELVDRILAEKVDGVVCYGDYTAVGLIIELLTRRVRVPEDVAITGFDNLPIGNSFALGVTTYEYPALAVARQAIRVMRARLAEPEAPPIKVLIPGRLIVRESSAPARPAEGRSGALAR